MRSIQISLLALIVCASCNKTPTTPTPPPTPDPPTLSCPADISTSARTSQGINITYPTPEARNGEGAVTVACTPSSDSTFTPGTTEVSCVATDTLNRTGSCKFSVTVTGPPRLRRTRIMAWGDSITQGQTVMSNDPYDLAAPVATAYPTVLQQLLSARYTDQTITVFNSGLPGEMAINALGRFIPTFVADAPEVVVLMEGYNDYHRSGTDIQGIDNAVNGIRQLAGEARRRGARVFICTLAPNRAGRIGIPTSALEFINERLRQVAIAEGAVLVDIYKALLPDPNGNVSIDGLHLTPLGYRRVAETVFAAIRDDLEIR